MVAVKLVGPDIDNLTIDNLTLTTTILEVKQKALAAMPAGGRPAAAAPHPLPGTLYG